MWADTEEARSDFILAGATAFFGPIVYLFAVQVLPFLRRGILGQLVLAAFVFVVSGLVPILLARYRDESARAFGLDIPIRDGVRAGILIAFPPFLLGLMHLFSAYGIDPWILAGQLRPLLFGEFEALVVIPRLAAAALGAFLLYTFLTVKARDGFAQNEISQLEALRTFGLGAAGAGAVVGLFVAAVTPISLVVMLLSVVALAVMILIVDRLVESGAMTTRATVLAPAIVALVVRIELFGGGLLVSLWQGLLAAGLVIAVVVLVETRRYAWAALPIFIVVALYPSHLVPFVRLAL